MSSSISEDSSTHNKLPSLSEAALLELAISRMRRRCLTQLSTPVQYDVTATTAPALYA